MKEEDIEKLFTEIIKMIDESLQPIIRQLNYINKVLIEKGIIEEQSKTTEKKKDC